jgi:hypothetical protein
MTNFVNININFKKINWFNHKLAQIGTNWHKFENFATLQLKKKSTEKLLVDSSPGRADILLKSRRAKEIKAMTGQNGY